MELVLYRPILYYCAKIPREYEIAPVAGGRSFVVHVDKLKKCGGGEEREEETEEPDTDVMEREEEGMNEPINPDPTARPKRNIHKPRRFQH